MRRGRDSGVGFDTGAVRGGFGMLARRDRGNAVKRRSIVLAAGRESRPLHCTMRDDAGGLAELRVLLVDDPS